MVILKIMTSYQRVQHVVMMCRHSHFIFFTTHLLCMGVIAQIFVIYQNNI